MMKTVAMKLIEAPSLLKPKQCRAMIASVTLEELWYVLSDRGGYIVHPVPKDSSLLSESRMNTIATTEIQKLSVLSLGIMKSQIPLRSGSSLFPTPPISEGIIKRKIIMIPCSVVTLLKPVT